MQDRESNHHRMATSLMHDCTDVLESLVEEQIADSGAMERIKTRIDELYQPEGLMSEPLILGNHVRDILKIIESQITHRNIEFNLGLESSSQIGIPKRILDAIVVGLVKNAVENTPDEGRIDISVRGTYRSVNLTIQDYGTGIATEDLKYIFTGFYPTQSTDEYSTRKPYDFNAGGKGTDLMRIKIFSERYGFKIDTTSTRCEHIMTTKETCPGKISICNACQKPEDCHASGMTSFTIIFPATK